MRTYGDVIDVRTVQHGEHGRIGSAGSGSDAVGSFEEPAQFLWRGRLYLVRDVLAHWVELGTWWSVRGGRPPRRSAAVPLSPSASPGSMTSSDGSGSGSGSVTRSVAADVGAIEREVWRVEASTGRSSTPGVYDLVRDVPARDPLAGPWPGDPEDGAARWRLARALD